MTAAEPVGRDAVAAAAAGLASSAAPVRETPTMPIEAGALYDGLPGLTLKLELFQRSGSFKARGATWQLVSKLDRARAHGIVAASGGNFGIAAADAAAALAVPATISVTSLTAPAKVDRLRTAGSEVVVVDGDYFDALAASVVQAEATGAVALHAYDDPAMVAGNGTMALELERQAPEADTVVVAVGGGGLLAGVLAWYGERVRVVAVETTGTASLCAAVKAGAPVDVAVSGLCADSLGARRIGALPWAAVQAWPPTVIAVEDDAVVDAQHALWRAARVAAEPGGAAALAALTSGAYVPAPGERVAVVVCGANLDPGSLAV